VKTKRKLKTKIHFNRVNMQRGDSRVWSAHNSRSCNQAEKIVVVHDGKVVLETVYDPAKRQPRAYLLAYADVTVKDGVTVVEV
jgi:hypothetical protein